MCGCSSRTGTWRRARIGTRPRKRTSCSSVPLRPAKRSWTFNSRGLSVLKLLLKPCQCKDGGTSPPTPVDGQIVRAHRDSPLGRALVLGLNFVHVDYTESVYISSRAMRLLLSGCTIHVPLRDPRVLWEVKLAARCGAPMRQGESTAPRTAG